MGRKRLAKNVKKDKEDTWSGWRDVEIRGKMQNTSREEAFVLVPIYPASRFGRKEKGESALPSRESEVNGRQNGTSYSRGRRR